MTALAPARPAGEAVAPAPAAAVGRVEGFHPGWYGAVMGTAVVGIVAYQNPGAASGLADAAHGVGVLFVAFAGALALLLGVPYAARWAIHPRAAAADLLNPAVGGLHGTFPGGLLVLALALSTAAPSLGGPDATSGAVLVLAVGGSALALVVGVAFAAALFLRPAVDAQAVNGSWFIPPVVTVIIPVVLAALAPRVAPADLPALAAGGYGLLGVGLVLFAVILSLLYGRLVLHPLPGAPLAPSVWIALGPAGVGALALLRLAAASAPLLGDTAPAVASVSAITATALWGLGLWWLAVAVVLLVAYVRRGGVPYSVGWWGFVFPLGALAASTLAVARWWHAGWAEALGVALFLALAAFWAVVAARTLGALRSGRAWAR